MQKSKIQPVILSGGSGSRLWPSSRTKLPKQLLQMVGGQTMLQSTALRLSGLAGLADEFIVVCNEAHRFLATDQLEDVGMAARMILEPSGRNTAPAVALAAIATTALAKYSDENPILLVLPADHVIKNKQAFHSAITQGRTAAEEGKLLTFGIVPTHAETGYGYIKASAASGDVADVREFMEKPDKATATEYVNSGDYFWNSGMFLFSAQDYLAELKKLAPEMHTACELAMENADHSASLIRPDEGHFVACPADSIDYAVMEKTSNAAMVPLAAGWSDVGSWAALHDVSDKDPDGNTLEGDVAVHDVRGSHISSESRLVTAVGVEDLVVVETKDAVMVTSRARSQDVKHLVEKLKSDDRTETELHRQVFRPWGNYDSIDSGDGFQVKRLVVKPGAVLSLQMHHHRAEHWVVVRGTARITLNDDVFDLGVNEYTHIPIGATHRIENPGKEDLHIIEVQCGDYLGEDDIVRFEDNYGREGTNT